MHKRKYMPFHVTSKYCFFVADKYMPSLLIAQYRNKKEDWCWSEKAMGKEAWKENGAGILLH